MGGWGPLFEEERTHDDLAMGFKRFVDLTGSDMDPPQHGFFGQSVSLMDDTEAVQMQTDSGLLDAVPGPWLVAVLVSTLICSRGCLYRVNPLLISKELKMFQMFSIHLVLISHILVANHPTGVMQIFQLVSIQWK